MEQPGVVIDTFRHLHKHGQVLRLQIELSFRAAKIKTQLGRQFAFRIFASMPTSLGTRYRTLEHKRWISRIAKPNHSLAFIQRYSIHYWRCFASGFAKNV